MILILILQMDRFLKGVYMKIVFIGCVESSEIILEQLLNCNLNVVGVITKQKSSFNTDFRDLSALCIKYGIPYKYTNQINTDKEVKRFLEELKPDYLYCIGWSQILHNEILGIPKKGTIGFHPAELPNNRGRHPIVWALALGLKRTASTFLLLDNGVDTGKILSQEFISIEYKDNAQILYQKIMEKAKKQIVDLSYSLIKEQIDLNELVVQKKGNAWRKRKEEDGKIDWRMGSYQIYNLVRALTRPYVGAHFIYQEKEYKVWKVKEYITEEYENIEPGKVLKVFSEEHFMVKAGNNVIEVLECDKHLFVEGEYLL